VAPIERETYADAMHTPSRAEVQRTLRAIALGGMLGVLLRLLAVGPGPRSLARVGRR
jgi:hypothetical protein